MFQLKLTFATENNSLPKNLDQFIVSFFKASAQSSSQEFYEYLYDKSRSILKTYTYSTYLPGAKFIKDRIVLAENKFALFFSGCDMKDLMGFYNGFLKMRFQKYALNGNAMTLLSVVVQNVKEIRDEELVIKMQSSLIARRHDSVTNQDMYFTCDDAAFPDVVKENVKLFVERMQLELSTEEFTIAPMKGKKVVVPVFGRNTDASLGVYKLSGSPGLLQVLYLAGMGARRSCGHGKFEIIA